MPDPPCLDELLNHTDTSCCLVSHLMISLQIDEHVFPAYKMLASNCLCLPNTDLVWTVISLQVVQWIDQKLFIALCWGSGRAKGARADNVHRQQPVCRVCVIVWPHSENDLARDLLGMLGCVCFHPATTQWDTGVWRGRPAAKTLQWCSAHGASSKALDAGRSHFNALLQCG